MTGVIIVLKRIKEHFETDGVDYLTFYFSKDLQVRISKLIFADEEANILHGFNSGEEIVINLNNVLYYKIHEKHGNRTSALNQNPW